MFEIPLTLYLKMAEMSANTLQKSDAQLKAIKRYRKMTSFSADNPTLSFTLLTAGIFFTKSLTYRNVMENYIYRQIEAIFAMIW